MSRRDTILYLREDADNRQKELAQTLGRQRVLLHEIQNKLQLLENYLAQYREQAVAAEQAGILSAQAMEMRSFIAQLEQVLKLQRENLQHQQQQVRWLQGEWVAARGGEKAWPPSLSVWKMSSATWCYAKCKKSWMNGPCAPPRYGSGVFFAYDGANIFLRRCRYGCRNHERNRQPHSDACVGRCSGFGTDRKRHKAGAWFRPGDGGAADGGVGERPG
jgi:Flagellar biosynthesis chaperone